MALELQPYDQVLSDPEFRGRLEVCARCEHQSRTRRCELLGGPLSFYARRALVRCPIGRWDESPRAAEDLEWMRLAGLAERCEFRHAVREDGCCGPRYRCLEGRRPGELAEPISVCVECVRALEAAERIRQ